MCAFCHMMCGTAAHRTQQKRLEWLLCLNIAQPPSIMTLGLRLPANPDFDEKSANAVTVQTQQPPTLFIVLDMSPSTRKQRKFWWRLPSSFNPFIFGTVQVYTLFDTSVFCVAMSSTNGNVYNGFKRFKVYLLPLLILKKKEDHHISSIESIGVFVRVFIFLFIIISSAVVL